MPSALGLTRAVGFSDGLPQHASTFCLAMALEQGRRIAAHGQTADGHRKTRTATSNRLRVYPCSSVASEAVEERERLDVRRVREEVEGTDGLEPVAGVEQAARVAGESRGIAGHVDH